MTPVRDLADRLRQRTDIDIGLNRHVVLFGQPDSLAAATRISGFVEDRLSARIKEVLLVAMASGGAFGLRLSDGRDVFLKLHAGEHPPERLQAIHDVQEALRRDGIPAARRILSLTPFRDDAGILASVHAFRDRGEKWRAGHRGAVEAAARGLARLDLAAMKLSPAGMRSIFESFRNPIYAPSAGVPKPAKRADSVHAEALLKRVAEKARTLPQAPIISHADWSSRNLRFWDGDVSSIFDFEALAAGPRPYLVGNSAVLFVNEPSGVANPADATARFIETYEQAAGVVFEGADAQAVDTGAAHAVARYLVGTVRSGYVKDEEAEKILDVFMGKFRARFARDYAPLV